MLNYNPKDAVQVLPEGEYNAVLEKYEEKVSQKGNQMGVLTWKVFPDNSNATPLVTDYITLPMFTWKLKRLAQSLGKEEDFKAGTFQPGDYQGTSTRLFIEVQSNEGYEDKNGVKTYVKQGHVASESKPQFAPDGAIKDDQIPF